VTDPDIDELVRAETRRQLAGLARRFVPLALAALTVASLLLFTPDQHREDTTGLLPSAATGTGQVGSVTGSTTPGSVGLPNGTASTGAPGGAVTVPGSTGDGKGGTAGGGSTGSGAGGSGGSAAAGLAVNGTKCTGSNRQFTFIAYAPLCTPNYTASNGGATAHGVTATTITIAIRKSSDYDAGKIFLGLPAYDGIVHDMTMLAAAMNKQFELYGRKVVIKSYDGKGGILSEEEGQGQAAAAADAQSAYDLGAFASGVGPPDPLVFQNALASRGIVSLGLPGPTAADYTAAYPYEFPQAIEAIPDVQAQGAATLVCTRLAGMPAVFAGDSGLRSKKRTFGLIMDQQAADAKGGTNQVPALAKKQCGATVKTYVFADNTSSENTDARRISTQMKSDGVTTALLFGDLEFSPTMTSAAVQNSYYPEWFDFDVNRNSTARQMNAKAVADMIYVYPWHPQSYAPTQGECYRIYRQADPTGDPESDHNAGGIFDNSCADMLQLFGALQAAGPNLTPATFGAGWFHQPSSQGTGDFGVWAHSTEFFSPESTFTLQYWKPGGTNAYDGGTGSYTACREPEDIGYLSRSMGSGQLKCLGR
jgi:hypothetical protein